MTNVIALKPGNVYVAVEVLGASTRVGHRSVHTAFLHVVTPGYYVGVMLAI